MDFEVTPEAAGAGRSVRVGARAASVPTALVRDVVENGSTPEQPWKSARELGWTSIDVPGELGGLELGFTALGLVVEQHGRRIAPGPFLATVTQFLPLVCEAGALDHARALREAGCGRRAPRRARRSIMVGPREHEPGESLRARRERRCLDPRGGTLVRARRRRRGRDRGRRARRRGRRRRAVRGSPGGRRGATCGRARREPSPRSPAIRRGAGRARPRARQAGRERRAPWDAHSSAPRWPPRSSASAPARRCSR